MYFDRYDICEAYHRFLSEYHEGQSSEKYTRLCKLIKSYRPGILYNLRPMSENAMEIYNNLVAKEKSDRTK